MSLLSIVVPVYYNEDTLEDLYQDLSIKVLPEIKEYELIFVDDGSGDSSWEVMNRIAERDPKVRCVKLSRNFGEHAALLAGLSVCTGDCAVTKQADLQEDSALILQMYASWKAGNKVVLAARKARKENPLYVFMANRYYGLIRKTVNKNMPSGGCDCYLIDRKVIEVLKLLDEKNSSLTLQVMWAGFQTDIIWFTRQEREKGHGRWTMAKKIKLVLDSLMSFSYAPIRIVSWIGSIFALASLITLIGVLVEYFTKGTPVTGWASLMCVLLLGLGITITTLGILGEYIWRTLDASRKRPPFIIDEVRSDGAASSPDTGQTSKEA